MENQKKRIGIIFGGRSGEHEVSLLSAASVIRVLNTEKYEPVYIGITKEGAWKRYRGDAESVENGTWLATAESINPGDLKQYLDFALPIVHGPYCEDGKLQGFLETMDIPYGGCGVLASALGIAFARIGKNGNPTNALNASTYVTTKAMIDLWEGLKRDGTTITQLDKMVPFAQFNELMGLQKIRDIEHTYASSTGR